MAVVSNSCRPMRSRVFVEKAAEPASPGEQESHAPLVLVGVDQTGVTESGCSRRRQGLVQGKRVKELAEGECVIDVFERGE